MSIHARRIQDAGVTCVIRYLYRELYGRRPLLHKIEALSSGESMMLDYSDWYHLLHLAARYGWRAQEDLSHYTTEEHAISAYEAQEIADALERAERDLETEGASAGAAQRIGVTAHFFPGLDKGPYEGALEYFSGGKGRIVSEFIAMGKAGELVVRQTDVG